MGLPSGESHARTACTYHIEGLGEKLTWCALDQWLKDHGTGSHDAVYTNPAFPGCWTRPWLYSWQAVSKGFSLTVTLLNDSGKDVRTDEYYQGCKLVLRARGLKRFTGLYVAGVSAEGFWEGFDVSRAKQ